MTDPLQELLAAGAVPTTSFPPTSRYAGVGVDALRSGRRRAAGRRTCAAASARARSASRCCYEVRVVEGDRLDLLAARAPRRRRAVLAARRRQRRDRPARADRRRSGGGCGSRCPRASREAPMAERRPPLAAASGPGCRSRRRARCSTRCSEVKVESRLGRHAERLRAHVRLLERARRCTRCSCSPAARRIPILRVVIVVTRRRHADGADRRRDDAPRDRAPTAARPSTLIVKGKDLTALMDVIDARRAAVPGDAAGAARARSCSPSTRRFGVVPLVIPSVARGRPDPDRADPAAAGHRLRLRQGARGRGRLRLLPRPGPGARHEHGVLGPGDQGRRAAAGAQRRHGRPHATSKRCRFSFDKETQGAADRLHPGAGQQGADPDPDPGHHAAQPAARRSCRRCRRRSRSSKDTAKLNPLAAAMRGLAYAGQHSRRGVRHAARSTSLRYGRVLQVAPARRRARRGRGVRRPLLRAERHARAQARRVQAELHARAQRPALDRPGGAGMSDGDGEALLRQVPRHGRQQRRPDADRPHPGDRARRLGPRCRRAGRCRACPVAGHQHGRLHRAADRLGRLGRVRAGRPDYPIWVGGFWGTRRRGAGARARPCRPASPASRSRRR